MDREINLIETIREVSLFSELNTDELERLSNCVEIRLFKRKDVIFQEGDPYHGFYLVVDGQVLVYKLSAAGKMLILHICRPGDLFADVPLFAGGDYPASAQTTHPTNLIFFPKESFEAFLDDHLEVCKKMLKVFARRLRASNMQIEHLTLHEVSSRLARYLLDELKKLQHPDPLEPCIKLDVSKSTIAAHLGTTLETLSRTLHQLTEDGILRVHGRKVFLTNLPHLRKAAE